MDKLLAVSDVAERYQTTVRSARKIMGEVGVTTILHRPYVRECALIAYENDRTHSTYYNRPQYKRAK